VTDRTAAPPGSVANERTSLAWVRTALGLAACALLAGRLAMVRHTPWAVGAAIVAAVLAFGVLGWSTDSYRRSARQLRERRPVDDTLPALPADPRHRRRRRARAGADRGPVSQGLVSRNCQTSRYRERNPASQ
jgi:hypothetical protein